MEDGGLPCAVGAATVGDGIGATALTVGRPVAVGDGKTAGITVACRTAAVPASAHPTAASTASAAIHSPLTVRLYNLNTQIHMNSIVGKLPSVIIV